MNRIANLFAAKIVTINIARGLNVDAITVKGVRIAFPKGVRPTVITKGRTTYKFTYAV